MEKGEVRMDLPPVVGAGRLRRAMEDDSGIRVLDVRTPAEYETMHIRGSYNVPLDTLGEHREELRRHVDEPIVLVCRSGGRARRAEAALRQVGMENLHVLDGGIAAWEAGGQPVERGAERWGLERQVRLVAGSLVVIGAMGAALVAQPLVWLAAAVGAGLAFSAVTDTCAMATVLAKLPYNRTSGCDVNAVVDALRRGERSPSSPPAGEGGRVVAECG